MTRMMGTAAWKCQGCYRCNGNGRSSTHQQRSREKRAWTAEVTTELESETAPFKFGAPTLNRRTP